MALPKVFSRTNQGVAHIVNYLSLLGALSVGFSWLAKKLTHYGPLGWPEAIFIGVGAACAVVLVLSAAAVGWRFFRPVTPSPSPGAERVTLAAPSHLPVNVADHPAIIALTKRISGAEGELQQHAETIKRIDRESAELVSQRIDDRVEIEGEFQSRDKMDRTLATELTRLMMVQRYYAEHAPDYATMPVLMYLLTHTCADVFHVANNYHSGDPPEPPTHSIAMAYRLAKAAQARLEALNFHIPPMPSDYSTGSRDLASIPGWEIKSGIFRQAVYIDNQLQGIWGNVMSHIIGYRGE
jgi:hypothetical protein